jgi:hypothetical protein
VNALAIRAEKVQGKLNQELTTSRNALTQAIEELEQLHRVADLVFEVINRMRAVTDYLLKEHGGIQESSRGSESFELMLYSVVEKIESQEPKRRRRNGGCRLEKQCFETRRNL